jgi:hypothetical protein
MSIGVIGRRLSHTFRRVIAVAVVVAPPARAAAQAHPNVERIVLTNGVRCHSAADGAAVAHGYHAGDLVHASTSIDGRGGQRWYFDSWQVSGNAPACWVPGEATAPYDWRHPETGYTAVVDHILKRTDRVSRADYVEIQNLLEQVPPPDQPGGDHSLNDRFGLLHFRSLQLIERMMSSVTSNGIANDPLMKAWILAHHDVLQFHEPSADWEVPAQPYWDLFSKNSDASWADELAWVAAQHLPMGDECDADCHLIMIIEGPQQYWMRLPHGAALDQALKLADGLATDALTTVPDGPPTRQHIDAIRKSLLDVDSPGKAHLLERLGELERTAKPSA